MYTGRLQQYMILGSKPQGWDFLPMADMYRPEMRLRFVHALQLRSHQKWMTAWHWSRAALASERKKILYRCYYSHSWTTCRTLCKYRYCTEFQKRAAAGEGWTLCVSRHLGGVGKTCCRCHAEISGQINQQAAFLLVVRAGWPLFLLLDTNLVVVASHASTS